MCGILAIFDMVEQRPIPSAVAQTMLQELSHRGPDGEGIFQSSGIFLGHRRLAVIDIAQNHQPMSCSESHIHIVFNGMIYNYKILREKLQQAGHHFTTQGDTETLLYAYKAWGVDMCRYLDGFYSFVIYDSHKDLLFIANDKWGKKPLYYTIDSDGFFYCASELPALLPHLSRKPALSATALDYYFTMGFIPAPRTIFDNIHKIMPAQGIICRKGKQPRFITLHADEQPPDSPAPSYQDAVETTHHLLEQATAKRLQADVSVGTLLSGGLDSSLITAIAHKQHPLRAFTASFPNTDYDETAKAQKIAHHLQIDHIICPLESLGESLIDDMAYITGEPFADASIVPTYLICKQAKPYATVLLGGDGGDEAGFGYARYASFIKYYHGKDLFSNKTRAILLSSSKDFLLSQRKHPLLTKLGTFLEHCILTDSQDYLRHFSLISPFIKAKLYHDDFKALLQNHSCESLLNTIWNTYHQKHPESLLRTMQATDKDLWLAGKMLVKTDRASMAAHTELRSPLLDSELNDYLATLPEDYLYDGKTGKKLFHDIAQKYFPQNLLNHPKQGFVFPVADYLRTIWYQRLYAVIHGGEWRRLQLFNPATVIQLFSEHQSRQYDHSRFLWALLQLDAFLNMIEVVYSKKR